jgi:hypothetical protein
MWFINPSSQKADERIHSVVVTLFASCQALAVSIRRIADRPSC